MHDTFPIRLVVNGETRDIDIASNLLLADLLREHLNLRGTKVACDQGACGACTVLLDGKPATSCLTFAFVADGAAVTTIEGMASGDGALDAVQQAFHDCGVPQCGFCTPGMVLMAKGFGLQDLVSQAADVEQWLQANICRCSGYQVFRRALQYVTAAEVRP
jgi:aerobic-type carbon monoxide dehydrogenase small subunit (CoxS/CutS family)